jgi:hypothetical protein
MSSYLVLEKLHNATFSKQKCLVRAIIDELKFSFSLKKTEVMSLSRAHCSHFPDVELL